jgi:single-strand DNA-binding protein
MALNKVILCGRMVADPELRQTDTGVEVSRFSVAVSAGKDKTDFFNVVAWRQTATFLCRYFHKGDGICIDGKLSSRSYEKGGVKHTVYEVIADNVGFSEGSKKEEYVPSYDAPVKEMAKAFEEMPVQDNLPF